MKTNKEIALFKEMNKLVDNFMQECDKITLHPNKTIASVIYKGKDVFVKPDYLMIDKCFNYLQTGKKDKYYYRAVKQQKARCLMAMKWELS